MKSRPVTQYICDFCDKRGLSAGHMRKHEKHCTKNPDRECRMCILSEGGYLKEDFNKALALMKTVEPLIDIDPGHDFGEREGYVQELNALLPKVREITNCPCCILAAMRQSGHPVPIFNDFDFKAEAAAIFSQISHGYDDYGY